jgi:hypothetical protein
VLLSQGASVGEASKKIGITDQTYLRLRNSSSLGGIIVLGKSTEHAGLLGDNAISMLKPSP